MPERGLADGLRVVEVGGGIAVPLVGMLLAEHGAEVVRLADPARPPVDPVLDAVLARGKVEVKLAGTSVEAALAGLLPRADVVLCDDTSLPHRDFDAVRRAENPALVSCRVSHFPPGGARADFAKPSPRCHLVVTRAGLSPNLRHAIEVRRETQDLGGR